TLKSLLKSALCKVSCSSSINSVESAEKMLMKLSGFLISCAIPAVNCPSEPARRDTRLRHRLERLDPCRKAEPIEACPHFRKRFVHTPGRRRTSRCDISRHGVALLWNQHPEPTGSRWATPTSSEIQQNPGQPPQ